MEKMSSSQNGFILMDGRTFVRMDDDGSSQYFGYTSDEVVTREDGSRYIANEIAIRVEFRQERQCDNRMAMLVEFLRRLAECGLDEIDLRQIREEAEKVFGRYSDIAMSDSESGHRGVSVC